MKNLSTIQQRPAETPLLVYSKMLPVVKEPRYQDNEYKFSRASSVINLSDDMRLHLVVFVKIEMKYLSVNIVFEID
jgi:hypothetical protein